MALTGKAAHRKDINSGIGEMQHRHFATVATIIREMSGNLDYRFSELDRENVAAYFAERLRSTNPNFDRRRFLLACGVEA